MQPLLPLYCLRNMPGGQLLSPQPQKLDTRASGKRRGFLARWEEAWPHGRYDPSGFENDVKGAGGRLCGAEGSWGGSGDLAETASAIWMSPPNPGAEPFTANEILMSKPVEVPASEFLGGGCGWAGLWLGSGFRS